MLQTTDNFGEINKITQDVITFNTSVIEKIEDKRLDLEHLKGLIFDGEEIENKRFATKLRTENNGFAKDLKVKRKELENRVLETFFGELNNSLDEVDHISKEIVETAKEKISEYDAIVNEKHLLRVNGEIKRQCDGNNIPIIPVEYFNSEITKSTCGFAKLTETIEAKIIEIMNNIELLGIDFETYEKFDFNSAKYIAYKRDLEEKERLKNVVDTPTTPDSGAYTDKVLFQEFLQTKVTPRKTVKQELDKIVDSISVLFDECDISSKNTEVLEYIKKQLDK